MPIDPLHGRRVPSGRRLARALASLFRSMLPAARSAVRSGKVPAFDGFDAAVVRVVLPLVYHEWHLGREQMAREVRRRMRERKLAAGAVGGAKSFSFPRVVKAGFPFGDPLSPLPAVGPATTGVNLSLSLLRDSIPRAVQQLVLALVGSITDSLREDIRGRLEAGVRAGESNDAIADRLEELFSPRRAYTIAATESSRASHGGGADYLKEVENELGEPCYLEWLASSDACSKCLALNGKRVRVGEPFYVFDRGNPAYRIVTHPPLHVHCMCSAAEVIGKDERRVRRR